MTEMVQFSFHSLRDLTKNSGNVKWLCCRWTWGTPIPQANHPNVCTFFRCLSYLHNGCRPT